MASFLNPFLDGLRGDALDSWHGQKTPYSLSCTLPALQLAGYNVCHRTPAHSDREPLSLIYLAQDLGEPGFGVKGANFGVSGVSDSHKVHLEQTSLQTSLIQTSLHCTRILLSMAGRFCIKCNRATLQSLY